MSFGTSTTYINAYIVFALVYLIASFTFVASALRVSTGLSRTRPQESTSDGEAPATSVGAVIDHGQRIVDYTQLATLLPLVYIVGSLFLGSVIIRDIGLARMMNVSWIAFTAICCIASLMFAALGIRESGAIGYGARPPRDVSGQTPEALQRVGTRLGVSAALLLLVAVFTLLNLWSIVSSLDALSAVDFLL
jgi:hypothetical protein